MKQIEITTKVFDNVNTINEKLSSKGFKIIRKSIIKDKYLCQNKKSLNSENIIELLSQCVLLRYLNVDNTVESKKITYKKKEYIDDKVISEEKINVKCEDLLSAEKLFNALRFFTLIDVNYEVIVYSNNKMELAFQNVNGLGMLLEYENNNDFSGIDNKNIIIEKEKMLNSIKKLGLNVSDDYDIKKAYELIKNKYKI